MSQTISVLILQSNNSLMTCCIISAQLKSCRCQI